MISSIIQFSIKNKLIVGLAIIALIAFGSYQVSQLPIDAVPDITNNQVQVITMAPSFGATDIERLVTFPIEQANSNISGLKEIRSFSRFGLSIVTIVFNDDVDVYWARQQVAERLQKIQSQIPAGIGTPELGPVSTGLGEIYQYIVKAAPGYENKYDEMSLRTIQDWLIRRQLMGVKGVAEVSSFGGKKKQYEIAIDPNKLQSYNLTINEVFTALDKNNQNTGGSYIEKGPTVLFIRTEGLIANEDDIKNIVVKMSDKGIPLLIRDVADVKLGYATRYGAMCYNDKGEVAGAVVMMLKGANSNEVIKNVKERVKLIQSSLPKGVVIEPFLDRTKMVNNAIGTVEQNLLEGALIVVFVLVLFLGNFRAGLIVASVIPLAMLIAISLMNVFGVSGNLMSLGALDFGLIVDGAVIIVEAVMHQITQHKPFYDSKLESQLKLNQNQMDEQVTLTAGKMMNSAVFGQLIILVVYLPIFTLQGIEGKMFKPMAQTVAFALFGAFVLSLTYIPMMSALFLSKNLIHRPTISDRFIQFLTRHYRQILLKVLRFPKIVLSIVMIMFASSIWIMANLGGEFIPVLEEGDFAVETRVLPGSNLQVSIQNVTKAASILKAKFPEVEKVVAKIGSGDVPTDPMPIDAADMMVILKDKKEWTSAVSFSELADKMGKELELVIGTTFSFQYPVQMRFNELMTGAKQDVVCKIVGENLDTLSLYAERLGQQIEKIDGVKNLYVEPITGMPEIIVKYKRAMLIQYGLAIDDVNKVINTSFAGQSAGLVFEDEKRFDLLVRLNSDKRNDLSDMQNLLIPTHSGNQIPLHLLAEVSIKNGPNQIQREDAKRRIVVGFNVRGRDVQSIVSELQLNVKKHLKLPVGYYIHYGGAFENLNAAKERLMIAVPISLIIIFLLFAFSSIKQSLLIYSAIPLSAIGGIYFLAIRGMPFSISAGIGFIALFGVAVLNGIVLLSEFNRLKKTGLNNLCRVVVLGTSVRLRPVLMTAFVASLGFLPMAISNGAGAEVQRPLATVVIGGLMIATLLTLFVLPVLYSLFEQKTKEIKTTKLSTGLLSVLFGLSFFMIKAQTPIGYKASIDSALKNNRSIKNEKLKSEQQKELIKTAKNIQQTNLSGEYGQINSFYADNRISLTQGFNFPMVYVYQKKIFSETWKISQLSVSLKETEIKKVVSELFYGYLYLKQKEVLLRENDSLYKLFTDKSNLRFNQGESNILEKITAQNQSTLIDIQLKQIIADKEALELQFMSVLNTRGKYFPDASNLSTVSEMKSELSDIVQHPYLRIVEQQKTISGLSKKLEKFKVWPDLTLGYSNMSMKGTGSDNVTYSYSTRFQSVQLGIGIPLFYGAQLAKVRAAKLEQEISSSTYEFERLNFQNQFQVSLLQFQSAKLAVNQYENITLLNAKLLLNTATNQFKNGEIDFLDLVMLTNQAITIQSGYLDALFKLNQSIIQLNYLTNKF
jgi:cobalt-zinc-cadmium resistance protein CzcA